MAANVGLRETAQQDFQNSLRQQQADQSGQSSIYASILTDQRQRELANQRGDQRMQQIGAQGDASMARTAYGQGQQNDRNAANIQNRTDLAGQRIDSREGIAYAGQQLGYDRMGQQKEQFEAAQAHKELLQKQEFEHQDAVNRAKASEANRRQNAQMSFQAKAAAIKAELNDLHNELRINNARYTQGGDMAAGARIPEINDMIQQRLREMQQLAPPPYQPQQQQQAAPPSPQPSPPPAPAVQPQYQQPPTLWQQQASPRTATNRQTGQMLVWDETSQQWVPAQ